MPSTARALFPGWEGTADFLSAPSTACATHRFWHVEESNESPNPYEQLPEPEPSMYADPGILLAVHAQRQQEVQRKEGEICKADPHGHLLAPTLGGGIPCAALTVFEGGDVVCHPLPCIVSEHPGGNGREPKPYAIEPLCYGVAACDVQLLWLSTPTAEQTPTAGAAAAAKGTEALYPTADNPEAHDVRDGRDSLLLAVRRG